MELYEEYKYKDLDWYIIGIQGNELRLLLKDCLNRERLESYVDDSWYLVGGNRVTMNSDMHPSRTWRDSYIYQKVLPTFAKEIGVEKATLMRKKEAEKLPEEIRKASQYYWLKTEDKDCSIGAMWCVTSFGEFLSSYVRDAYGVRPVITIAIDKPAEILTDKEKAYLKAVIEPFKNKVLNIEKQSSGMKQGKSYILICVDEEGEEEYIPFPYFASGEYYKNMSPNKEYTLKELGLEE